MLARPDMALPPVPTPPLTRVVDLRYGWWVGAAGEYPVIVHPDGHTSCLEFGPPPIPDWLNITQEWYAEFTRPNRPRELRPDRILDLVVWTALQRWRSPTVDIWATCPRGHGRWVQVLPGEVPTSHCFRCELEPDIAWRWERLADRYYDWGRHYRQFGNCRQDSTDTVEGW